MSRRPLLATGAIATALAAGMLLPYQAGAAEGVVRIHDIQGTTRVSPLNGQTVSGVQGVVTGIRTFGSSRGFWFQDTAPDDDPATSEGVFVFTSSTPTVQPGDAVTVDGRVSEFVPGGASSGNQSLTEITRPTVAVSSAGNRIPAPAVLDAGVPDAYVPDGDPANGDSVNGLTLQPGTYALDRYESLEGMNVAVGDSRVVGPTDAFAELWVTVKPDQNPAVRGGTRYGSYTSQNSGRLQIQSLVPLAQQPFPVADTGDVLAGTTEGPLDYNQFGGYTLTARTLGTVENQGLAREVTRKQRREQLAVAAYNVENLDPADPQAKFDRLAGGIVTNLRSPDVVALEEIQDDNGAKDDGTVTSGKTLRQFTDAIVAAGGPRYEWRGIDPADDKDGGEPGGNIRQVFLYNPDRVSFTDREPGDAATPTAVTRVKGKAQLTHSPGRIDPANDAWTSSRKPLAGEFVFRKKTYIVIANHFASKGGDEALTSQHQPPVRSSEVQRLKQAQAVNGFVKDLRKAQPSVRAVVLGDFNDFEFSATTKALTDGGVLSSAVNSLPRAERYSYDFQGNAQVLDQTLITPALSEEDFAYDIVHINAEFADQASDHDPQVLRITP